MELAGETEWDARVGHQRALEELYDKNQLMPRVRGAFEECGDLPFRQVMVNCGIPEEFGFDLLAQIAVHRRADVATMVGCLRHHCETAQEVADLLEVAVGNRFLGWDATSQVFVVVYEISRQLQAELDLFQFPLPMVVPPLPVQHNLDTGYLTSRGSIILRDNHTDEDVCLDHVNRVNAVRHTVNADVARKIQNRWKNLDRRQPDEEWEDFRKRRKAFEKYDGVARRVLGLVMVSGGVFHLTHRYDKRGRTYCVGYHVSYQGADWNKAVIEFADKEVLTD